MEQTQTTTTFENESAPKKRIKQFKLMGWISLGLFCFLIFTLIKLPSPKVKAFVQGHLESALSRKGIGISIGEGRIRLGLGLYYYMTDVSLFFPASTDTIHIDSVKVKPSILPIFLGRLGASTEFRQGDGSLWTSFSGRDTSGTVKVEAEKLDLAKSGLFEFLSTLKGGGTLDGDLNLSGNLADAQTLSGRIDLGLNKFLLDAQSVFGFQVPRIQVSQGKVDARVDNGKLIIKSFTLGKGAALATGDDVVLNLSGDIQLQPILGRSTLNLLAKFSISPTITKSISLIDMVLGQGRQPDGSYIYRLKGTIDQPEPLAGGT